MATEYAHVFYSGPIDAWFDHVKGVSAIVHLILSPSVTTAIIRAIPLLTIAT